MTKVASHILEVSFAFVILMACNLQQLAWAGAPSSASSIASKSANANAKTETLDVKVRSRPVLIAISSSAKGTKSPEVLFQGGSFSIQTEGQFVKLGMVFNPPIFASKIVLESCANAFNDGVEFSISPNFRRIYAEGGARLIPIDIVGTEEVGGHKGLTEIRTLAVNFRGNQKLCINRLSFLNEFGSSINIKTEVERAGVADKTQVDNSEKFLSAGLGRVLDQELNQKNENERSIFRFRSDGSYFIFGKNDDSKSAGRYTAIGDYQIVNQKDKKITLQLNGHRLVTAEPWDGVLSEKHHGDQNLANSKSIKAIADVIQIERTNGGYMIRNRENKENRVLPFSDIFVRLSSP